MKNKCFKVLCMFALTFFASVLAMICSYADVKQRTQLPADVQAFFANNRWKGWEITGWVNPNQQKKSSACAFAAVKSGKANTLVAFGWENGKWVYKWHNSSALPQVAEPIVLGTIISDNVCFTTFYVYNKEIEEMFCVWEQQKNSSWELQELYHFGCYCPQKGLMFFDTHKDGVMQVSNAGWVDGKETNTKVYGTYQRNLRYFNLAAFPLTLDEARTFLSNPPEIPHGDFQAQNIKFTSGKKYPVYTGPGTEYLRSANGKASVSTNDWIQVFGKIGDWIMIQYDITSSKMRIGYIESNALPKKSDVPSLCFDPKPVYVLRNTIITDEPLKGETPLGKIVVGQKDCYCLADFGDGWWYIQTILNGKTLWGFVRSADLQYIETEIK